MNVLKRISFVGVAVICLVVGMGTQAFGEDGSLGGGLPKTYTNTTASSYNAE